MYHYYDTKLSTVIIIYTTLTLFSEAQLSISENTFVILSRISAFWSSSVVAIVMASINVNVTYSKLSFVTGF